MSKGKRDGIQLEVDRHSRSLLARKVASLTSEATLAVQRRIFANGTGCAAVSDEDLQNVIDKINVRPRKILGYGTPCNFQTYC